MRRTNIAGPLCWAAILLLGAAGAAPADEEAALFQEAQARIEKHRKADVEIRVRDAQGNPVPGAKVRLEQTNSAFLFGCNIFMWGNFGDAEADAAYKRRFAELFNFATLPFYWWSYEPRPGEPSHDQRMAVAAWCLENGIRPKGHPLAWNYVDPAWLPADPAAIVRLQLGRIGDCMSHFKGKIGVWDVVNEMAHFDRAMLKDTQAPKLTEAIAQTGPYEYTRRCFLAAREANPEATLLINDYRMDADYEKVIENLVDEKGARLYDVIGLQSHMHSQPWPNRRIWEVCERFAKYGVPLHFTETTIVSGDLQWDPPEGKRWPSTPEGERRQAEEVVRFYTMVFSHPATEALTWWDFCDRGAWKGAPSGFLRADTSPKPAYEALHELIRVKWRTNTEVETDAAGTAKLRAFHGDYHITATAPGGASETTNATVAKEGENRVEIVVKP